MKQFPGIEKLQLSSKKKKRILKPLAPYWCCFWCDTSEGVKTIDHLVSRPLAVYLKKLPDVPKVILDRRGQVTACESCNNKRSKISCLFRILNRSRTPSQRTTRRLILGVVDLLDALENAIASKLDAETAGYLRIEINLVREFIHGPKT